MRRLREEAHKREVSGAENYDKSIITLATAFLGFSIGYLKDFASAPNHIWVLVLSWLFFTISVASVIASFLASQKVQRLTVSRAMRYYENHQDDALSERIWVDKALDCLNLTSGVSFVTGLMLSSIFVFFNIPKGEVPMPKQNGIPISKGISAPTAESRPRPLGGVPAPTYEQRPTTQPAPAPEPPPTQPSEGDKK